MRWRYVLAVVLAVLIAAPYGTEAQSSACSRAPHNTKTYKQNGDGRFRIKISGNPDNYVPGEVYTVSLEGERSQVYNVRKFTGFLLVVEPVRQPKDHYQSRSVGTFQLYSDALTQHSDDCPNAVTHTSAVPKSEIQVLWTAPPQHSGCVRFRATVSESRDVWYMDDGELTKELCEELQENEDTQPEVISDCCACDEAKYEVTFEGLWSRHTHPKDYVSNEWLTHFSDIIGASHSSDYKVWEYGGYSSDGLRQVAEWGSTRSLESELKRQSDHIRTIIKARGLWYPNVNGKTFAVFRVDNQHHLMSLVSMLGPSPDWIVGVSALELCTKNCSWLPEKTLNLYPWDAGTDSGLTYEAANSPTIPREKIRRITNSYPNDQLSPFYDPTGLPMKPLARLTITRQRVYEKSCSDTTTSVFEDDNIYSEDIDSSRPECQIGEWTEWEHCSVTCGKGIRSRTRNYMIPMKATMLGCNRQTVEREMCAAEVSICEGGNQNSFTGVFDGGYGDDMGGGFDPSMCAMTGWTPWSDCTATCGKGFRMRTRHYLNRMGRKKCDETRVEKQMCSGDVPDCAEEELPVDPTCTVTQWSDWSPCSGKCGPGVMYRQRHFYTPSADKQKCGINTMERKTCNTGKDCNAASTSQAKVEADEADCTEFSRLNISVHDQLQYQLWCRLGKEKKTRPEQAEGKCMTQGSGIFYRHSKYIHIQYNIQTCMLHRYKGHKANTPDVSIFNKCIQHCPYVNELSSGPSPPFYEVVVDPAPTHPGLSSASHSIIQDCKVSDWSPWSQCTASCGTGTKEKTRQVMIQQLGGGRRCPKRLQKKKTCNRPPCNNGFGGLESESLLRETPYEPYTEYSNPSLFRAPEIAQTPLGQLGVGGSSWDHRIEETPTSFQTDVEENYESGDCVMGEWGPWSPCTHTCGTDALQQRFRSIISKPHGHGEECGPRLQRRFCTLPPCSHSHPRGC
ncbi:unnamed protein product, partial [Meganyctiphanes norvegica]